MVDWQTIFMSIISSSAAVALITGAKEIILDRMKRKDTEEDYERADEKEDNETRKKIKELAGDVANLQKTAEGLKTTVDNLLSSERTLLKDKIKYLVFKYIEIGEITIDEKQAIQHMWKIYHYDFKGNGDLDEVMPLLDTIPIKVPSGLVTKAFNTKGGA